VVLLSILTRYLGPSIFGEYTFVTGYVGLFAVFTDLGFQSIAVREMARSRERAPVVAGQLLLLRTSLSMVALLAAVGVAWVSPIASFEAPGVRLALTVAAVGLLFSPLLSTAIAIFQTLLRMGVPAFAEGASRFVALALVAVVAAGLFIGKQPDNSTKLVAIIIATGVGPAAAALFAFVRAIRVVPLRAVFDRVIAGRMVRDGIPFAVFSIFGLINYRIDVLILSFMKGMSVVGLYGVATKLLDVALTLAVVFMGLVFPVLSMRFSGPAEPFRRAFEKAFDVLLIAGMGVAVMACCLSPTIVPLLAGHRFQGAALPVAIIAWAVPITFVESLLAQMLVVANRQLSLIPVVVVAAAVNVVLNIILIPRMGASAPALVTCISDGVSLLGLGWLLHRYYGLIPSPTVIAKIGAATALAAVPLLALRNGSFLLAAVTGGVVYLAFILVSRVVTIADLRVLLVPTSDS
jgi:O-antigen/teichoic acid export membrane protein